MARARRPFAVPTRGCSCSLVAGQLSLALKAIALVGVSPATRRAVAVARRARDVRRRVAQQPRGRAGGEAARVLVVAHATGVSVHALPPRSRSSVTRCCVVLTLLVARRGCWICRTRWCGGEQRQVWCRGRCRRSDGARRLRKTEEQVPRLGLRTTARGASVYAQLCRARTISQRPHGSRLRCCCRSAHGHFKWLRTMPSRSRHLHIRFPARSRAVSDRHQLSNSRNAETSACSVDLRRDSARIRNR